MNLSKYGLKDNEQIVRLVRQRKIIYFFPWLASLMLIILPFFFIYPLLQQKGIWGTILLFFLLFIGVDYGIRELLIWYNNCLIITNQRLVIITQKGFFRRSISKIDYRKIQNVSVEIKGFFSILFAYGTLKIFLGSTEPAIEVKQIGHSSQIQEMIIRLQKELVRDEEGFNKTLSNWQLMELARNIKQKIGEENFRLIAEENQNETKSIPKS